MNKAKTPNPPALDCGFGASGLPDCGIANLKNFMKDIILRNRKSKIRNREKSPLGDLGVDFLAKLEDSN